MAFTPSKTSGGRGGGTFKPPKRLASPTRAPRKVWMPLKGAKNRARRYWRNNKNEIISAALGAALLRYGTDLKKKKNWIYIYAATEKQLQKLREYVRAKTGVQQVEYHNYDNDDKIYYPAKSDAAVIHPTNSVQQTRVINTTFEFGKLPSKTTNLASRMNGAATNMIEYNTLSDLKGSPARARLRVRTGFNQKKYFSFMTTVRSEMNLDSFFNFFPDGAWVNQEASDTVWKGMMTRVEDSFKIACSNKFFPIKVKIHLIQHEDHAKNFPTEFFYRLFGTNNVATTDPTLDLQGNGSIPVKRQLTNVQYDNNMLQVEVSPGLRLSNSSRFREDFHVVKTISQTLSPGDVWCPRIVFHSGPGYDLARIRDVKVDFQLYRNSFTDGPVKTSMSTPALNHFYVFEIEGVQCEAYTNDESNFSYIGTSPGEVTMELKTAFDAPYQSMSLNGGASDPSSGRYLVRVYRKDEEIARKYNMPYSKIGAKGEADKLLFIPIMSDMTVKYSDNISDS